MVFDWKTSKAKDKDKPDIYMEYIYQVSAYVNAYNEINNASVSQALILSLAKDKPVYNIREVTQQEIQESFEQVFLPCLKIYDYQRRHYV